MIDKVIIDPRSSFQYSSFYVKGLYDLIGRRRISYQIEPFHELDNLGNDMRFVVIHDGRTTKYFIHTDDSFHISQKDYQWCDVYGCVNTNYAHYPKDLYPKLISLCPSFAIVPGTRFFAWRNAICGFVEAADAISNRKEWNEQQFDFVVNKPMNVKKYWTRFVKGIYKRQSYSAYTPKLGNQTTNYVFFLSTLWYNNEQNKNDEGVNLRRANFIRACKELSAEGKCVFEGGLVNCSSSSTYSLFADCLSESVSMNQWMSKTHNSTLVFNTPAFWDCHGWKLGEYLAMGKCIISTKLSNDLPAPLIHGEHIHYVDNNKESTKSAIEYILSHPDYQRKLEEGALEYWNKYGSPLASLRLLGITDLK